MACLSRDASPPFAPVPPLPPSFRNLRALLLQHSSVLVGSRTAVAAAGGATSALKNLMMELRKACNHPFLVDYHPGRGRERELGSGVRYRI